MVSLISPEVVSKSPRALVEGNKGKPMMRVSLRVSGTTQRACNNSLQSVENDVVDIGRVSRPYWPQNNLLKWSWKAKSESDNESNWKELTNQEQNTLYPWPRWPDKLE